jgi:hypothetical protein
LDEASAGLPAGGAGKRQLPPGPMKIQSPRYFKRFAKASRPGDKRLTPDSFSLFKKVHKAGPAY